MISYYICWLLILSLGIFLWRLFGKIAFLMLKEAVEEEQINLSSSNIDSQEDVCIGLGPLMILVVMFMYIVERLLDISEVIKRVCCRFYSNFKHHFDRINQDNLNKWDK